MERIKKSRKLDVSSSEFLKRIIDTLSSHVVVLDSTGRIVLFNEAWSQFAELNEYADEEKGLGVNYIELCRRAQGDASDEALQAADGIESVISGREERFYLEYPCHSLSEKRWFLMRVNGFKHAGKRWAIVSHENMTEKKENELEKLHLILELRAALSNVKTLTGLIAMCPWCKKIRSDKGFWERVENYLAQNSDTEFNHAICPDCSEQIKKAA